MSYDSLLNIVHTKTNNLEDFIFLAELKPIWFFGFTYEKIYIFPKTYDYSNLHMKKKHFPK